ncbi:uncharacterized protein K452DRAFT_303068 [Aplosporella prunicola CBS 121167]|uniref:Multifunctional fusion protein n=1 Tax=Aplosporella prunicola CBS 121167 TaxID=1176127 RepID=A0A6A6AVS3_9PEZI|nr:uncharacterized protein K452DRAFT_303068 [Aplosporella prunicola CBS 121167]KAF2136049.1 hypothetical protein K452DRAFT_303068 [Aplosporella prunicola CBS 121167]
MMISTRTLAFRAASKRSLPRAAVRLNSYKVPAGRNEPNLHYAPGSPERTALKDALDSLKKSLPLSVSAHIAGSKATSSKLEDQIIPSDHATVLSRVPQSTPEQVSSAIEAALAAKPAWESKPFADRAAIFLRAAELVAGKYRNQLIAATMLGQGKNAWQGEIDAAAELADFYRFNAGNAQELLERQPTLNAPGIWSRTEYRPLEGFVYAVSPFNFTAIGGNLVSAPALLGNVVVWKPSPSSAYASYLVYQILLEAGLPPNVIQFVTGDAAEITKTVLAHKQFAGLHFTGSSDVFRTLYGEISKGVVDKKYVSYPRLVAETSGKNFHLLHPSADVKSAVNHTIRAAFEYQGQKCSACSRAYIPKSLAKPFIERLKTETEALQIGDPAEFENFLGPVIHRGAFEKIKRTIDSSNNDKTLQRITGGTYDDSKGFYIKPTVYLTEDADHALFDSEIFGPVLVLHVYPDEDWKGIMKSIDERGGGFALTGAVFAADRDAIREAEETLKYSAGNFYINCKTTGAVIGQQSFGGGRASGTNDKAGSANLLLRFTSPRTIKEEFMPLDRVAYPSNEKQG